MSNSGHAVVALRLAATLAHQSDLIRSRAQVLSAAGAHIRWRSPAATAFGQELESTLAALNRCAAHFDGAAGEVYRLAVLG